MARSRLNSAVTNIGLSIVAIPFLYYASGNVWCVILVRFHFGFGEFVPAEAGKSGFYVMIFYSLVVLLLCWQAYRTGVKGAGILAGVLLFLLLANFSAVATGVLHLKR